MTQTLDAQPQRKSTVAMTRRVARARPQNRSTAQSVWRDIENTLQDEIARGVRVPGERLPSELALAQSLGVNRHTVRQALSSLAIKGLVRIAHGSGTFVADFAVELALGKRIRHSQNLARSGLSGTLRVLGGEVLGVCAVIARKLAIRQGSNVLRLHTVGVAHGRPITYSERYFPANRFPHLQRIVSETGSITQAFTAHGVSDYTRRESHITAQMPEHTIAMHLGQPMSRPVLFVESVNVDESSCPIEFARTYFAADRVTLLVAPEQ